MSVRNAVLRRFSRLRGESPTRRFEELTIRDMAGRLKEPTCSVKSRPHRARDLVREYLLDHESGTPSEAVG